MVRKRTFKTDASVVPDAWRIIASQPKTILTWPTWSEVEPLPTGKGVTTSRFELHTASAETIEMMVPLADEGGVGLEGVRLRMTAWPFRREYDLTALLEVPGNRSGIAIARLDAWAPDPHMNVRARNHPGLGHLPAIVGEHHVHRFQDNVKLGMSAFGSGNLPLAAQVTSRLESFRDFLRVLGDEFKIDGLDQLNPPNWTVMI